MRLVALLLTLVLVRSVGAAEPRLLVHYMPWYASKEISGQWGWHWTMNHYDPEQMKWDDKREIASHDYPLVGPYDSGDDHLLEYHVLLMKIAGIDGVVIDWYGVSELNDHAAIHRNTQKLIPWLKRAGLSFAVCYEDNAVKSLTNGKDSQQAAVDLKWAEEHLFQDSNYLRQSDRPVLLIFGPQHLNWKFDLSSKPLVLGLPHLAKKHGLDGAFAWPPVADGKTMDPDKWQEELGGIYSQPQTIIATAFPGFRDIYKQAGIRESYGNIESRNGRTWTESLQQALDSKAPLVQIATWNDFGEGTVVEPTRSNGFRYLEKLPRCGSPADLRLPAMLYQLRKRGGEARLLDQAAQLLFASKFIEAEKILAAVNRQVAERKLVDGSYQLTLELLYREEPGISATQNQRCRLDLYAPTTKKSFSTVIWFHGGGLTQGERSIPIALKNQGIAVVAANYRLGPEVKSPVYIEDAAAAIAWTFKHIEDFGGDPRRIFVGGHSAGAYLSLMCGLDKQWLAKHKIDADQIAGLIPLSPQVITHFSIRNERGIAETQPIIDNLAPLFHVRPTAPPILLVTGDREKELMGRYEECAYFWRMMKLAGHKQTLLHELDGFDHGGMPEPALPLLLRYVETMQSRSAK